MKENKFKTEKLKEDAKSEFIVWKFNDNKLDNVFLFGSVKDNFINLLIYTDIWPEEQKIAFLEKVYQLNKKRLGTVFLNLPPATVWQYTKQIAS